VPEIGGEGPERRDLWQESGDRHSRPYLTGWSAPGIPDTLSVSRTVGALHGRSVAAPDSGPPPPL